MNAQTITFNHDPEVSASEIPRDDDDTCCCNAICCPCNLCYWYIAPLCCQLLHTIKCLLFHVINLAVAIFLFTFDVTMIAVGIGLIPLCCMGIPLLWISFEMIIAFSRIDLGLHYYLLEDGSNLDPSKDYRTLITLSVYLTDVPLCCCYDQQYTNCMELMINRIKHLFTNIEIYKYILYHVIVRPIITCCSWWITIVAVCNVGLVGFPIWYLSYDRQFIENQVVLGYADGCRWPNDGGIVCPKDYVWIINTFGRALCVGVIALLALPLTLRLNNYFAYVNKVVSYRFYTLYYSKDREEIESSSPILDTRGRLKSV